MEKIHEARKSTMLDKPLEGYRVAIPATNGFEETELVEPRKALESAGAKTTVVAPDGGSVQGMKHSKKRQQVNVDRKLSDVRPTDFDAVLLPGAANADNLRVNSDAQSLFRHRRREKADGGDRSRGVAADFGEAGQRTPPDQLSHAAGRRSQCGRRMERRRSGRSPNWLSSRKPGDIPALHKEIIRLLSENAQKPKDEKRAASGR